MHKRPLWITPERKLYIASLYQRYLTRSGWRVDLRTSEAYHPELDTLVHSVIMDWVQDDLAGRRYEQRLADRELHRLNERGALRGHFNAISRSIYFDNQPMYELQGLGVSGLTFRPFAKVRIASSLVALHVDITGALRPLSKCKKRKVIRHGRPLPSEILANVSEVCAVAVSRYLS
jgi:hypothetical protein